MSRAFTQGMEYTAGGMFYTRVVAGGGYRPFNKTLDDVERLRATLNSDDEVLVFKMKTDMNSKFRLRMDSPIGDMLDLGWYHEVLIGITREDLWVTEFGEGGGYLKSSPIEGSFSSSGGFEGALGPKAVGLDRRWGINRDWLSRFDSDRSLQYLGKAKKWGDGGFLEEARKNPLQVKAGGIMWKAKGTTKAYNPFWRNCQDHVTAIVNRLTLTQ